MLVIPGFGGFDTCDGYTRRDFMRIGGSAVLGLSLANLLGPNVFAKETNAAVKSEGGGPGFGRAKNIILCYLQGGPSHLDLWDPKDQRPREEQERIQSDQHQDGRPAVHGVIAEAGQRDQQAHDDPFDELHPRRAVQPHRRHLPDAHRLYDGQGFCLQGSWSRQRQKTSRTSAATFHASSRPASQCCHS